MEFIRTIREKYQTKHQNELQKQAEYVITLSDFCDNLYIAFQDIPLIPIQEDWTSKKILEELTKLRNQYINAKLKQPC